MAGETWSDIRGSPPLTRGIRLALWVRYTDAGFTPAHAGNTDEYLELTGEK